MIFEQVENIFEHYPQCLVHPVSCTGLSHDTLTKQIKKSYPDYYREYKRFCLRKKLAPGKAYFNALDALFGSQYIVTLTIKYNWQEKIQAQVIKSALQDFLEKANELKLTTIALPDIKETPPHWLQSQFEKINGNGIKNCFEKIIFFPQ